MLSPFVAPAPASSSSSSSLTQPRRQLHKSVIEVTAEMKIFHVPCLEDNYSYLWVPGYIYIYVTVGILIIRITRLLTYYYNYMNTFLESLMRVLKKQRLLIQSSPRSLLMLPMNMGSISSSSSLLTITGPFFLLFKILLFFLGYSIPTFSFFFFSGMFHTLNDLLMAHSLKLIIWATLGNHVQSVVINQAVFW